MPKTPIMVRVSNEELAEIDRRAKDAGETRAGWVAQAVNLRIASETQTTMALEDLGPAALDPEHTARLAPDQVKAAADTSRQTVPDVPRESIHKPDPRSLEIADGMVRPTFSRGQDQCAHPFRTRDGYCPSCGHQR